MADFQERTEEPTGKRQGEFRKRGEIPKSPELSFALSFATGLYLLGKLVPEMGNKLAIYWRQTLLLIPNYETAPEELLFNAGWTLWSVLYPFLGAGAVLGIVFGAIPSGIPFVETKFDLGRLNPVNGFKRLWRPESVVELVKSLVKLTVIGWALYSEVSKRWEFMLGISAFSPADIVRGTLAMLYGLAMKAAMIGIAFGALDLLYKWRSLKKKQKMTKEEIKEERKSQDGNPLIKGKIRVLQRQMSRRTRLAAVAKASVVVVNPTHFAVAMKYDRATMSSPEIVAKGLDLMALKIIEIAKANGVPVHRNPPLARSLYKLAEPGDSIPPAMYKAVAEVFAWVYAEKRKRMPRPKAVV